MNRIAFLGICVSFSLMAPGNVAGEPAGTIYLCRGTPQDAALQLVRAVEDGRGNNVCKLVARAELAEDGWKLEPIDPVRVRWGQHDFTGWMERSPQSGHVASFFQRR